MKRIIMGILIAVSMTSCASYQTYKGSRGIVLTRKVMELKADGKTKGMFMQEIKEGNVPSEIPFTFGEVMKERPWWALGAGALDVGTGLLLKSGFDQMTESDSPAASEQKGNSADRNVAGGNNIIIQGNQNSVSLNSAPEIPIIPETPIAPIGE